MGNEYVLKSSPIKFQKRWAKMKKIWAVLLIVALVFCPVVMACIFNEAVSAVTESGVFDPKDEGGGTSPNGVGGNDPEHPQ